MILVTALGSGSTPEDSGGFDGHIDTEFLPGKVFGFALGEDLDSFTVHNDVVSVSLHLVLIHSVD